MKVKIVGAGLAGSEAAWQLVSQGIPVEISEMRPGVMTKAHKTGLCAELVCSNSFRGNELTHAVGLLKAELVKAHSLIMEAALHAQVPAGTAMAVDRMQFSQFVNERIRTQPLISFRTEEVCEIPAATRTAPVIVATGPLTSRSLSNAIQALTGQESLAFFDAISPIILGESIDHEKCFRQSRYDKGGGADYLNIPLNKEEYHAFIDAIAKADKFHGHGDVDSDSIEGVRPFEGCMPIEDMVERGPDTLLFGPLKPVGLSNPKTGMRPYAAVQLRQDDKAGTLWSMVGMQTRMRQGEQKRIFSSLPGLEQAEFVRLGSVHRNTFIDSPKCLHASLEFRGMPGLFFAGQLTGSEGYVESTAGGLVAGVNAARLVQGKEPLIFPGDTAIGSLMAYISDPERKYFQPMNISFGLMPSYVQGYGENRDTKKRQPKKDRRLNTSEQALSSLGRFLEENY